MPTYCYAGADDDDDGVSAVAAIVVDADTDSALSLVCRIAFPRKLFGEITFYLNYSC